MIDQSTLDGRMVSAGKAREVRSARAAISSGSLASSSAGVDLLKRLVAPVVTSLEAYYAEASRSTGALPALAQETLGSDPRVVAYISLSAILNGLMKGPLPLTSAAILVAKAIEDETLLGLFKKAHADTYEVLTRTIKRRGMGVGRATQIWKANAKSRGVQAVAWPTRVRVLIGTQLIGIICEATGAIVERTELKHKRQVSTLHLDPQLVEWIEARAESLGILRPLYLPSVAQPVPWQSTSGGGYGPNLRPVELYSRAVHVHKQYPGADLSETYSALNRLQSVPWRVNTDVLGVMRAAWDRNLQVGELPCRDNRDLPTRPADIDTNHVSLVAWKKAAREVHEFNALSRSARLNVIRTLNLAQEFSGQTIYFPSRCDSRGRIYPLASGLNPQGSDLVRPLLRFEEGCEVAAGGSAYRWLLIHGANTYGNDKVSLEDRARFSEGLLERVKATVRDPLADLWWADADKPWAFLAWCFDMVNVLAGGLSHIPVALDGSCNGIQHLSALLLDPEGGAAVNLTPSAVPNDIYQTVADRVMLRLEAAAKAGDETAALWWAFGIDRKLTKRQVMVLPYGGTRFSCLQYTKEAVRERLDEGADNPFGDQLISAIGYLTQTIWEAIHEVVVAAREVMSWLQSIASLTASKGLPVVWTSPSGFLVQQRYLEEKSGRIDTKLFGKLRRLRVADQLPAIDQARQVAAIAPNFIHSLDAAALVKTVNRFDGPMSTIHDSYGTLASRVEEMRNILREEFVSLYDGPCLLHKFKSEVELRSGLSLPSPPLRRDLNIRSVLSSDYFFA